MDAFPDTAFHGSKNGWVTSELFVQWFHFFLERYNLVDLY